MSIMQFDMFTGGLTYPPMTDQEKVNAVLEQYPGARNDDGENGVKRTRLCLTCNMHFQTVELYAGLVAGQAYQASLFRDMVSDESRQKAKDIIERNGGKP